MRKCEQILQALETLLKTISGPDVTRNKALPDDIRNGVALILWDGEGEVEEYVMGGENLWSWAADLQVIVQGKLATTRDEAFDELCEEIGDLVETNRTLGGLCDWLDVLPGKIDEMAVLGAPGIKGGSLTLRFIYSTSNPTG